MSRHATGGVVSFTRLATWTNAIMVLPWLQFDSGDCHGYPRDAQTLDHLAGSRKQDGVVRKDFVKNDYMA